MKKYFFDNLHHTLHQDSRATIGTNGKKIELNFFSKDFNARFSESTTSIFSSLGYKYLVLYSTLFFP